MIAHDVSALQCARGFPPEPLGRGMSARRQPQVRKRLARVFPHGCIARRRGNLNLAVRLLTLDLGPWSKAQGNSEDMSMASFTIGTLAEAASVRRDTIRYYERTGLLPAPGRTSAGYRLYSAGDLERLRFIRGAQGLGFTLAEIAQLLALKSSDTARAADVLRVTEKKIDEEEARISQLRAIKDALEGLAANCPVDAPVSDCPILAHISKAGRRSPVSAGRHVGGEGSGEQMFQAHSRRARS
jgi:MerR family transcriptional regulator, copper efflux regulator